MTLQHVPLEWVNHVWPQVEEFFVAALQYSGGDYTIDHLRVYLTQGTWRLIVAVDPRNNAIVGAASVELFNRPTARVALVTALGGAGLLNAETLSELKVLLASFGATTIECMARPSVVRLLQRLGFTEKYRMIEVKL